MGVVEPDLGPIKGTSPKDLGLTSQIAVLETFLVLLMGLIVGFSLGTILDALL